MRGERPDDVTDADVELLYRQANKCALVITTYTTWRSIRIVYAVRSVNDSMCYRLLGVAPVLGTVGLDPG